MKEQPKYSGIFQYIVENYQFPDKSSPEEEFQEKDIEDQYEKLDGHVNEKRFRFGSLEDAAGVVKEFAIGAGADLVGFTRVKDDMKFEGADVPGEYAVILGYEMDREVIQTAPEPPAGREALRAYWRLGYIVQKVAEFIRYLGYPARGHQVRSFIKDPPTVLLPIAGVHAGLGEVGRMGLLITPEFGPRVRLGAVTTDLVLPDSGPKSFGVEEFCSHCDLCMEGCMGNAI
ncbi:MAG: reductive dehalogenase domain-containing protein, partial [Candidatus Thermoplasmatota archaeon]|nr:reductive dehalogenase domain-containing protein [Candidatus Thermoplasmatota archaeon]